MTTCKEAVKGLREFMIYAPFMYTSNSLLKENDTPECPIARIVAERVKTRAAQGMKKYGVTMERTDVGTVGWIDHAIEEALDLAVYLTRLKQDIENLSKGR